MGDFWRSLKPGNDHALAADLHKKEEAKRKAAIKAMSDRDNKRTAAERQASAERARRHRRGGYEPPAPGFLP
ncbi:hypothetical protein [Streptomyces sp. KAU_LT]|uniref:hypothetical protein n=1 Tax=Streptomyces sp. KAU_LT TaxID=3046669 RepID=UPI0024B74678|nr:hypothetical protein [Streptomyces sp. KAU_LT]MDI9836246.1 hypothetical protein [Streptomyces sp. KAU_LT]